MKKNIDKNKIYGKANYNEDVVKLVKILVVVVLVLGLVYLGTAFLTGEINLGKEKDTETEDKVKKHLIEPAKNRVPRFWHPVFCMHVHNLYTRCPIY